MQTGKTTSALNLRSGPSTSHDVITVLPALFTVEVLNQSGEWLQVSANGKSGFVHRNFVQLAPPPSSGATTSETPPPAASGKVRTTVNLRATPDTNGRIIRLLRRNTPVTLKNKQGDWYEVEVGRDQGFIFATLIVPDGEATTNPIETVVEGGSSDSASTGRTTTILNMRSGPGLAHAIIRELPLGTDVTILEADDVWFKVKQGGLTGYVHSGFLTLDNEKMADGFIDREGGSEQPPLDQTPSSPAVEELIVISRNMTNAERSVAVTWNRFGGLFATLGAQLGIDPGVAVAVFVAESGGAGFINGRMVIRFENHIFNSKWGKQNPEQFNRHFQFDPRMIWQGHKWRPNESSPWRGFHGNQDAEWEVFNFARTLSDTAAKLSISMGGPQIMGFNHHALGFESVHQMFDAFNSSEENQIIGFFDFVRGPGTDVRRITALKRRDFETFASLYNGPGQAATYASIIGALFETFERLRNK